MTKYFYLDHTWPRTRKTRHVVRFIDGVTFNRDGSPFHNVRTFPNKPLRDAFLAGLRQQGYVSSWEWRQRDDCS